MAHIIQHNNICACLNGLLYHVQSLYLYLNFPHKRSVLLCHFHSLCHASGGSNMVVLQQYAVGEIISVVISAAYTNRIFLKNTVIRCCLSCIKKLCLSPL